MRVVTLFAKVVFPLTVLVLAAGFAVHTVANRPPPETRARPTPTTEVEVMPVTRGSFDVLVHTRGTVHPRTESTLVAEVSGRIVEMSPSLRAGRFFEAGDVLAHLDARDYQAEVDIARANETQARSVLAEEEARAEQAAREWRRLGESGEPDALVLRKPQLASARAALRAAQARLTRARLNVERTTITAPYAGRVLEQNVDIGQYVPNGAVLGRIYAVDYVEVRLPLDSRQLAFVDVPESYRGASTPSQAPMPPPRVALTLRIGRKDHVWQGALVRAEGAVDTRTRQLFVIAQIDDPYAPGPDGRPPLKIGQFVEAAVEGRTLNGVFVIPRSVLRTGNAVLLVNDDERLEHRDVEVVWSDEDSAVVATGLDEGERLVLTPLGPGMAGTKVRVAGQGPERPPGDGEGGKSAAGRAQSS